MEIANLLTKDQLKSVFLNLEELIEVNSKFSEILADAIDIATEEGDEVCIFFFFKDFHLYKDPLKKILIFLFKGLYKC
jgi:hypothetical protein